MDNAQLLAYKLLRLEVPFVSGTDFKERKLVPDTMPLQFFHEIHRKSKSQFGLSVSGLACSVVECPDHNFRGF